MQGGRSNIGRVSVNLGGKQATKLTQGGQPSASAYQRPQASGAQPVRTGSRVVTTADSAGLVEAGRVTGTPTQPVQIPKPAGSGSAGGAYTREVTGNG
jgi:hypothetical protein